MLACVKDIDIAKPFYSAKWTDLSFELECCSLDISYKKYQWQGIKQASHTLADDCCM